MVERCPDKTEVDGPIPSMLTMPIGISKLNSLPSSSIEQNEKIDLSILFAEDNDVLRDLLIDLFEIRYTKVKAVENGDFLVKELLTPGANYDCVVTDNSMPIKSGLDALREIRSIEKFKNLPVVVLTADNYEIAHFVKDLGAICLGKPPKIDDLYSKIERITGVK